jgi:hypothetical protein
MTGAALVGLVFGKLSRRAPNGSVCWLDPRSNRPVHHFRVGHAPGPIVTSDHSAVGVPNGPVLGGQKPLQDPAPRPRDDLVFNITPRLGVNHAKYGMLRREVRQIVGQAASSIRRIGQGPAEDVYGDRHAFFRYDAGDRLQSIEFASTADVAISHYRIAGLTYPQLREQVLEWDASTIELDGELRSTILGLVVRHKAGPADAWSLTAYPDGQP